VASFMALFLLRSGSSLRWWPWWQVVFFVIIRLLVHRCL
jgi:hypothetical protein